MHVNELQQTTTTKDVQIKSLSHYLVQCKHVYKFLKNKFAFITSKQLLYSKDKIFRVNQKITSIHFSAFKHS